MDLIVIVGGASVFICLLLLIIRISRLNEEVRRLDDYIAQCVTHKSMKNMVEDMASLGKLNPKQFNHEMDIRSASFANELP